MMTSAYISCSNIAFQHLMETLDFTSKPDPWAVHYPTPEQPDHMLEREYDAWLDEFAEELGLNDETKEITCPTGSDLDHQIHRPDDDPADIANEMAYEDGCQAWRQQPDGFCSCEDCSEPVEEDEPACGGCSGCCECLGDPEVEPRFDTLHEQETFYRETYG